MTFEDRAAVEATSGRQTKHNLLTVGDAVRVAKEESWDDWERSFAETSQEKGYWYKTIQTKPQKKPWFKHLILNNGEIRKLSRIRSGHMLTKDRRYQWKWENTEECDLCEEVENIKHILYDCPKHNSIRSKYPALEYFEPLEEIFKQEREASMTQIHQFLLETKIQI